MLRKVFLLVFVLVFVFSFADAKEKMVSHGNVPIQFEESQVIKWDKAIQGTHSEFWDFDGPNPFAGWTMTGVGWGQTGNNTRRGAGCAYCDATVANPGVDLYPDNHHTDMYSPIFEVPDPNMKGIRLEFWMHYNTPDYIRVWIQAWDVGGNYLGEHEAARYTGNNGRYRFYRVDWEDTFGYVTVTQIRRVRFCFCHQWGGTGNGLVGIGAFVDDVKLIFHYYDPTVAMFEAVRLAGKAPLEVQFMNTCNGTPNHFIWDYGDGVVEQFDEARPNWTNPYHTYTLIAATPKSFDVTLTAWVNHLNDRIDDALTIPDMIYADPWVDYIPMELMSGGDTWPGEGWENVCDHDVYGANCKVAALPDQSAAVFKLEETPKGWDVSKIRIMVDTAEPHDCQTNFAKKVVVTFSMDDIFDMMDPQVTVMCERLNGEWNCAEFPIMKAKYVHVDIEEARGGLYHELVEIQLLGLEDPMAKEMPTAALDAPATYDLAQNHPNPFNPETRIQFQLPEPADVELAIYNIQGQLVRTLVNGNYIAGFHNVTWNATDLNGQPVAGGVYIYKLQATGETKSTGFTKKMILMK